MTAAEERDAAQTAELRAAAARWRVPDVFTPAEGAALATAALDAVAGFLRSLAGRWRGTVPPPPWPAGPELVTARRRVAVMRDGLAAFGRTGATRINPAKMAAVAGRLRTEGATLWREALALAGRADKMPRDPRDLLPALDPVLVAIVVAVLLAGGE